MRPAGLRAFRERDPQEGGAVLVREPAAPARRRVGAPFKANRRAWRWFETQAPWYRRTAEWWVMSAKREETRARRLATLIASSANGAKAPPFILGATDLQAARRR